jgi:hypothetical protein
MAQAVTLTKVEYKADKTRISADYKMDKKACDALKASPKAGLTQAARGSAQQMLTIHSLEIRRMVGKTQR